MRQRVKKKVGERSEKNQEAFNRTDVVVENCTASLRGSLYEVRQALKHWPLHRENKVSKVYQY